MEIGNKYGNYQNSPVCIWHAPCRLETPASGHLDSASTCLPLLWWMCPILIVGSCSNMVALVKKIWLLLEMCQRLTGSVFSQLSKEWKEYNSKPSEIQETWTEWSCWAGMMWSTVMPYGKSMRESTSKMHLKSNCLNNIRLTVKQHLIIHI